MNDIIKKVEEFHKSFEAPIANEKTLIPEDRYKLRYKLMIEETDEYLQACQEKDMTGIADALSDKLYILCGTIIEHGLQDYITDLFAEVHSSNMSKLGNDGLPIRREDGKIIKGPNYYAPDLTKILYK